MRVGLFVEPMLLQRDCSGADQVRALLAAFAGMAPSSLYGAADVRLFDPWRECVDDYDLIHVLGAGNGNHQVVQAAAACGVPVLLQVAGDSGTAGCGGLFGRAAQRLLPSVRRMVDSCDTARQRAAMAAATLVVVHGSAQRHALAVRRECDPARIRVVPPGIDALWFDADPALCRQRAGIRGEFALSTGPIGAGPDLVNLALALNDMMLPLVLCSETDDADPARLRQLRAIPGVMFTGSLRHEPRLLASMHAAASVYVMLPSDHGAAPRRHAAPAADTTRDCSGNVTGSTLLGRVAAAVFQIGAGKHGRDDCAGTAALAGMTVAARLHTATGGARADGRLSQIDQCHARLPAAVHATAQRNDMHSAAIGSWPAATAGALAALAAGTAVIGDAASIADMARWPDREYAVKCARIDHRRELQSTILQLLEVPPVRERVCGLVREQAWEKIASRLMHCYADAKALHGPAPNVFVGRGGPRTPRVHSPRQA